MNHFKLITSCICIAATAISITLLFRRSNMLMAHYANLNSDVSSIKNFLLNNSSGPRSTPGTSIHHEHIETPKESAEVNPIVLTRNNINNLQEEILELENMVSSSDGNSDEEYSDEYSEISYKESEFDGQEGGKNSNTQSVMDGYDLANIETNSELAKVLTSAVSEIEVVEDLNGDDKPNNSINGDNDSINGDNDSDHGVDSSSSSLTEEVVIDLVIRTYTKRKLENLCASKYLSKSGNKNILIKRLLANGHSFGVEKTTSKNISKDLS